MRHLLVLLVLFALLLTACQLATGPDPTPTQEVITPTPFAGNPHEACTIAYPGDVGECVFNVNYDLRGPYTIENYTDEGGALRTLTIPAAWDLVYNNLGKDVPPNTFERGDSIEIRIDDVDFNLFGWSQYFSGYESQRYAIVMEGSNSVQDLAPGDVNALLRVYDGSNARRRATFGPFSLPDGGWSAIGVVQFTGSTDSMILEAGIYIPYASERGTILIDSVRVLAVPPDWGDDVVQELRE